jgi:hypothetical protein
MMLVGLVEGIGFGGSGAVSGGGGVGVEVLEVGAFPEEVDGLFGRLEGRYEAVCERTREWLAWRYERHPEYRYRIAVARRGGELVGYVVVRAFEFQGDRRLVVCDWWCEEAAEGGLLDWVVEVAGEAGVESVAACFPPWAEEFRVWQGAGFRVLPTSMVLCGRSHVRQAPHWFAARWFTTLGDSDLC